MKTTLLSTLTVIIIFFTMDAFAQQANMRILTFEETKNMMEAAEERARQDDWNVVIAIVDAGGHLLALSRMDDVQIASIEIAIKKAKTAAFYRRPTKSFQDRYADGATSVVHLPGVIPFEGGIPIEHEGKVIGAIGVSGVTAEQDGIIANAALNSLSR